MKVRADEIKHALSIRHAEDFFLTEVKTGPSTMAETLRLDAFAIKKSWTRPCFTGYEVKVSHNDFARDDKYIQYKKYCNKLFIVCPKDLIQPEEIESDIGLMYYNPEKQSLYVKRSAQLRDIDIPKNLLYYIILSRLYNEKHPFFSSDREFIEAYIQDKQSKWNLGIQFKSKLIDQVIESDKKVQNAEFKVQECGEKVKQYDEIKKTLIDRGIAHEWDHDITEKLEEALQIKVPENVQYAMNRIDESIKTIKSVLGIEGNKQ